MGRDFEIRLTVVSLISVQVVYGEPKLSKRSVVCRYEVAVAISEKLDHLYVSKGMYRFSVYHDIRSVVAGRVRVLV